MADRKVREGAEGYTQFDNPQAPYNKPFGLVGRFFKKFFSREVEDFEDQRYINPITRKQVAPSKPLQGDAVQSNQIVKIPATFGYEKSSYPILPQLENDRKKRYKEYEDMDGYPEISSAFDIYSDDCTQENIDGTPWDIVTDDEMVKSEVRNMFDQVNMTRYLWDISRNVVKYGDMFIETIIDLNAAKKGIQRIKILNPSFIFRVEDEFGYLKRFLQEIPRRSDYSSYGSIGPVLDDSRMISLDPGQIVHFRLHTSDPTHYPYGKSVAAAARVTYKSLKMMEDAMLIYRLVRAPERRIFYIDTGSLPASKAEMHIKKQMDKFKKNKSYNRQTGNIEENYNALAADEDFYIAVNGRGSGTKIDTLPGADNLGEVDDVKYFRDKLLAAMKIPKDYIVEKDNTPERKANLAQLDVKFARVITRIQKSIELGLETLAKRHLMLRGFPNTLINELRIKLPAPSDMALKRQLDTDEQKARVVQAVKGLGIFPMEKIYKDYYQLSDNEIENMKEGLERDQKDPVFGAMAQAPGAPPPPPGGALPPPEGESPPPGPEPQPESINIENMKSLAIEADCDDELLKLLEDMSKGNHFNK
tara:strand:+ start:2867 stop:4630 length:1764 start_codon:yes stop_codon:yes gene_type:complete